MFRRWYTHPRVVARLTSDGLLLEREYPQLQMRRAERSEIVLIEGTLRIVEKITRVPSDIMVRVELGRGYPRTEPVAYDSGRRCVWGDADGHVNTKGDLCLWLGLKSLWDAGKPDGLLDFIGQIVVFYERYFVYESTGKKLWPGPSYGHGIDGYVEYAREQLGMNDDQLRRCEPAFRSHGGLSVYAACPCDSGEQFGRCHHSRVKQIRRELRGVRLRYLVEALASARAT